MSEKHQGWIASLSNGETVFQSPNVPGERTAWGKLQNRCAEEEIHITQIQLQIKGVTLTGMANADGYSAFYEEAQSWSNRENKAVYQGIGSVLGEWVVVTFINDSGNVWQDLRQLSDMRPHCQIKPVEERRPRMPRPSGSKQGAIVAMEDKWDDDMFYEVTQWVIEHRGRLRGASYEVWAKEIHDQFGVEVDKQELSLLKQL